MAEWKTIFKSQQSNGYFGNTTPTYKDERVLHDTLNNKFYGEKDVSFYTNQLAQQIKSAENTMARGYTTSTSGNGYMGNYVTYTKLSDEAKTQMGVQNTATQSMIDDLTSNYVKSNQFESSYNAYTADWNKLFEANYKNPRIESEQNAKAAQGQEQYDTAVEEAKGKQELFSANNLTISPKEVGTGTDQGGQDTAVRSLLALGGSGLGL